MSESLNSMLDHLETEEVPSLADFAEEPGGAWPVGWYSAEITHGYVTGRGKEFHTEDTTSKNGDSRNARLCLKLISPKGERTMQESFNYRSEDFSPERLEFIKEARAEYKNVKGRWSDSDAQRSSLALAKIGQIERALGFTIRTKDHMVPEKAIGQKVDVRLGINDDGFNKITAFAKAGEKTGFSK